MSKKIIFTTTSNTLHLLYTFREEMLAYTITFDADKYKIIMPILRKKKIITLYRNVVGVRTLTSDPVADVTNLCNKVS